MPPKPSEKAEKYRNLTQTDRILKMTLSGYQPTEIAEVLGIQRTYVYEALENALSETSQALIEHADRIAVLNIMRIEEIIQAVRDPALGVPPAYANEAVLREFPALGLPDRDMLKIYLQAMKLEVDIAKIVTGVGEDRAGQNINVEHMEVTFTGQSPLYQIAKESMQADWMQYADENVVDLLIPDESQKTKEDKVRMTVPDQERRIKDLERRLKLDEEEESEEAED